MNEESVVEKLVKAVRAHLVNNFPSLKGRVTTIIILTRFRESLISQKAKDSITEAIKELYHEPTAPL
jgi:hypothetical protein